MLSEPDITKELDENMSEKEKKQVRKQLKFVAWLKSHKMYNQFASWHAMQQMMAVWVKSEQEKRVLRKKVREVQAELDNLKMLVRWKG